MISDAGIQVEHIQAADLKPFRGNPRKIEPEEMEKLRIAAEQLGRKCYAMEIEPKYVDVAVKRWENLTDRKAERVGE